ncbi:DUF6286 domain-containing protein [Actinokineospora guangxiensis]|uniref:DUF6286 domain-containing protein n=1 Tax=Actinokineospora guangxiensis TaxID=1490288 RepID=A0ABW0ER69_9PSEU
MTRSRRRLAAALTALVVLVVCVLTAVVALRAALGDVPADAYRDIASTLRATAWDSAVPTLVGAVAAVLGVVLLAAAALPGSSPVVPLRDSGDGVRCWIRRRGYRADLRDAARGVDGVSKARVRAGTGDVLASVRTRRSGSGELGTAVHAAVEGRLGRWGLAIEPAVRVRVRRDRAAR